ncbi:PrsW family intramembrane metalloprotease [Candidatus Peregrinibacteria bacterium]|jgi:RsiW-degrading membrane proteinase PrsW (M82 family)|nr:PrsW family intramembrane metalloprotease [Candidatus Peregrinibacteria bacterium]MBT7736244.1 PrsW family intramembrane metalloprotease [Candidatus Peregrinibacteria bacterium]
MPYWVQIMGAMILAISPVMGWMIYQKKKNPRKKVNYGLLIFILALSIFPVVKAMPQGAQIIGSIAMASIPAVVWGVIFYKKNPEKKNLTAITFFVGALAVFPILLYKFLWQFFPWINAFRIADFYKNDLIGVSNLMWIPLSVIITFMIVGIIEELMKLLSVKLVDDDEIKSIDDSIEFFIIAALGFAFTENILYFYNIWITQGSQNLFLPFVFRSSFSTFAHLIFSGILGYYYGVAHFAKPILQDEIKQNRHKWIVKLHKMFNLKKSRLFHEEKMLEGVLIAVGLHAIFNIFLEMNMTFLIVPFLVAGYMAINYLFAQKENHKQYGKMYVYTRNHPHPKSNVHFKRSAVKSKQHLVT